MNKTKKIYVILMLCIIAIVCSFVTSNSLFSSAEESSLSSVYEWNSSIVIPSSTIEYKGQSYDATDIYLKFPSGIYKSGKKQILDEIGLYSVIYSAKINGETISKKQYFTVNYPVISLTGKKSSAHYGSHSDCPDINGMVISVAPKETAKFNYVVDLSKMSPKDDLIKFFFTPQENGKADANIMILRVTDIYDEDNYFEVEYRSMSATKGAWADDHTYIAASVSGGITMGSYSHINSEYGYATYQSMVGIKSLGHLPWDNQYELFYDYNNLRLTTNAIQAENYVKNDPIADFDDTSVFTNPWSGFTTGEAIVSIYGKSYQASTMNLVVTSFAGKDLSAPSFADSGDPIVKVDMCGNEVAPDGKINTPYALFNATAFDAYSGKLNVDCFVYYSYGTSAQINVSANNGFFTPQLAGAYTIVYSATDRFGNQADATLNVNVPEEDNALSFTCSGGSTEVYAGQKAYAYSSLDIQNAKGKTCVNLSACLGSETFRFDADNSFIPMKAGTYTITIECSDYVENVKQNHFLKVQPNPDPIFLEEAKLPLYFIKGQTYLLPKLLGYDITDGNSKLINSKIFISLDGKSESEIKDGEFTVNAESNVKVKYQIEAANGHSISKEYTISVKNVTNNGILDLRKYFDVLSGNADTIFAPQYDDYLEIVTSENSSLRFINPVQAEELVLHFKRDDVKDNFDKLNIYLTDSKNANERVKFTYYWDVNGYYLSINGGAKIAVPENITTTDQSVLLLGYNAESLQAYSNLSQLLAVTKTVDGNTFNGFSSNKVYVEFELENVNSDSGLIIYEINGQSLSNFEADPNEPQIFCRRANGDVGKNAKVSIYGARAYDVLNAYTTLTMTVKTPSGNFAVATDGTILDGKCDASKDYEIIANEYGVYTVVFSAKDGSGLVKNLKYGFSVVDMNSPEISIDSSSVSANLGDLVKIKNYSVSDDITDSENINVFIAVLNPDLSFETVDLNDKSFKANKVGQYVVYICCFDGANNISIGNYTVNVK